MNNLLKHTFFILISVFFASCVASQNSTLNNAQNVTELPKAKKRSVEFLLEQIDSNKICYEWFAAKAKVRFESQNDKASFTAVIRMKKDSLIWLTLKKMNVEGARVQISPQFIEILDHQQYTYTKKPFRYLKDEFGLELTFQELQELIIGNPVLYQKEGLISVILENQNVLKTPESEKTVLKIFFNPANFLLNELRGSMNNNSIGIVYSDYESIGKEQIPATKDIDIDSEEIGNISVQMTFSSIILNEVQKMNFEIPDSYTR